VTGAAVLAWLEKTGTPRHREGLVRYGIRASRAYGVPVGVLLKQAQALGKDRALAASLWRSGVYEARLLAAMVDDPRAVTRAQMDAWARDFDNWGVCDTVCWHLFDYTPHAFAKIREWSRSPREFVKRAAFAMIAGQAAHNRAASDPELLALLPLVEAGARDERNFVKKAVSWALRRLGHRNPALHAEAVGLARRLLGSEDASARWVGRDALRDLERPAVRAKLARTQAKKPAPARVRRRGTSRRSS
jgi:3-methyladenine DNA glycosylase AlkD